MTRPRLERTENASEDACQNWRERFLAAIERLLPFLRNRSRRILAAHRAPILDPDDLVQEVLLVALVKMDHLRLPEDQSLLGFLEICMRNRVRDEAKKRDRLVKQVLNEDSLESPEPTALGAMLHLEETRRLHEAWTRLDLSDRALIAGRALGRMTFLELARSTRRASPDAARIAFSRAIAKVRRLLRERDESRVSSSVREGLGRQAKADRQTLGSRLVGKPSDAGLID